ncbi:YeeE/YedE family protein [Fontimonas sp. SYSU GA230001]|uniref:YeeE/YedE family protein n=1 Tax=Fontimonas sp. SYSU GA230001 TaxID=3142450 RepID=UPI0032B50E93
MESVFLQALAGGVLIGVAASLLLLGSGQIAGISGILAQLSRGDAGVRHWRAWFLVGMLLAPWLWLGATGRALPASLDLSVPLLIGTGLLVGFGTRRANGCTSGHGVCGLGNRSIRSLVAVATFMGVAAITVFFVRHVIGVA